MNTRNSPVGRRPLVLLALVAGLAVPGVSLLSACGGGGSGGYTDSPVSTTDRRPLPTTFTTRAAVNYSPYRTSRSAADLGREVITPANVLEDLRLVKATGIGTIRLFSSRAFAETVLKVIRDNNLDLKVQLGIWISTPSSPAIETDNLAEIDRGIALANAYRAIVDTVSVGNETMVSWSSHKVDPADMARYIVRARSAIQQPVTTNDNYAFWAGVPKAIADVVDFAAVHTYPLLDTFYAPTLFDWRLKGVAEAQRGQAMVKAAADEAKRQFGLARAAFDKLNLPDFPMVIGETGWVAVDTAGGPNLAYRAHPVNQKLYFDAMQDWATEGRRSGRGPLSVFFFQAFDEPWKQGDDGWGLFNQNRQARYVVQGLGTCGVTWACEAGSYTVANAAKWVAPTLANPVSATRYALYSTTPVTGEVRATGLRFDPFASTAWRDDSANGAPADAAPALEITPNPVDFGWGLFLWSSAGTLENLSNFANGRINFSVRSDGYPGRIEVGISTDTEDRDVQEAFVRVAPGEHGYCNTNQWCNVSIPVADFVAANPKLDLRYVNFRFIIADRFSMTGKPNGLTGLPRLSIDNVHWSR
ncbi:MAG: glycosyl hydrolase family 17 protein [Rubrivivax sp.]|jgi:exo-beta-1,3-glucanase (GH17 family)|nr:glycosyl hydrolase family 17 protein [Rubrivivax sp.]